jgi:hypothetical protein
VLPLVFGKIYTRYRFYVRTYARPLPRNSTDRRSSTPRRSLLSQNSKLPKSCNISHTSSPHQAKWTSTPKQQYDTATMNKTILVSFALLQWSLFLIFHGAAFLHHDPHSSYKRSTIYRRTQVIYVGGTSESASSKEPLSLALSLIGEARGALRRNDTDIAYDLLIQASQQSNGGAMHTIPGLLTTFEELFRTKISLLESGAVSSEGNLSIVLDRMGLASLLSDQGRYQDASHELGLVVQMFSFGDTDPENLSTRIPQGIMDKATSMLFRTRASICEWKDYERSSRDLLASTRASTSSNQTPAVHPFEALTWPCISLEDATGVAHAYAMRAMTAVNDFADDGKRPDLTTWQNVDTLLSKTHFSNVTIHSSRRHHQHPSKPIKVGYLSPDLLENILLPF